MGSGIAQIAALGGYETLLHDPFPAALEAGAERAPRRARQGRRARALERRGGRGGGRAPDGGRSQVDGLAGCDLVIEAAPEDLA